MNGHPTQTRRVFARTMGAAMLTALGLPPGYQLRCAHGHDAALGPHPDPRPGIDGSRVLTREELGAFGFLAPVYDGIRAIPHIADGIRCPCGCAETEPFRSLLVCFESNGMAKACEICQAVGRMTARLHGAGRTLDQIREAVDARFG